jgi:ABC-type antimicrobial peptide transport system permease subunit
LSCFSDRWWSGQDVLPFLGNLVGMGTGLLAFLLATPSSLLVVALPWIYYRPVLAILLLAGAVAIPVILARKFKKLKTAG